MNGLDVLQWYRKMVRYWGDSKACFVVSMFTVTVIHSLLFYCCFVVVVFFVFVFLFCFLYLFFYLSVYMPETG